jgi:hypothetical protein
VCILPTHLAAEIRLPKHHHHSSSRFLLPAIGVLAHPCPARSKSNPKHSYEKQD